MPTVKQDFDKIFSIKNLTDIFNDDVANSNSTGTDGIDSFTFSKDLANNIATINKKIHNNTYRFTRYKQKLISKGPDSYPREVCIPTVRDRITLKALNQFLKVRFGDKVKQPIPQRVTKDIKRNLHAEEYNWIIKLDIENFYPSIEHKELTKRLKKFIKDEKIISLIEKSISRSTTKGVANSKGIPQGLPISNILSALYLVNLDKKLKSKDSIFYSRYVDDIMILCDKHEAADILSTITKYCHGIGLSFHSPGKGAKTISCSIEKEFSFLGYLYNPTSRKSGECSVSTKQSAVSKLSNSLIAIFTSYSKSHRKSKGLLQWKLNLRITGCISEQSGKGWVFFFSEIDDKQLLYSLDSLVFKLCKRFSVAITTKSFIRTWHEINSNRNNSKYIPNFNDYSIEDMVLVIENYYQEKIETLKFDEETIRKKFWGIIKREERDLESDIQGIS